MPAPQGVKIDTSGQGRVTLEASDGDGNTVYISMNPARALSITMELMSAAAKAAKE